MTRRWGIALVLSIAAHFAVVGGIVGGLMVRGLTFSAPIDVEIGGMRLDEVHDLPLGPPPSVAERPAARPRPRPRRPPAQDEGELAGKAPQRDDKAVAIDDSAPDAGTPRATSLRQYGPEGSRVTVLLRLDRLRDTPYAAPLDALLGRLPDRRDLLEGTGLDLYKNFDALLIATPNPLDYTVTFLAARHRLRDGELRAALERGATATGRVLTWRTEGRRPFAERHARAPRGPAAAPGAVVSASRDDRLIVLPAPGLVVVTPPIYRPLLLASMRPRPPATAVAPDAGAGAGRGETATPAGATAEPMVPATGPDAQWGALLRRLDAEDGIMPGDAVALISAVDIFSARSLRRSLDGAPPARAQAGAATGTILGLPVPKVLTASIGTTPTPFVAIDAEMETDEQARQWEAAWPGLHQRTKSNPYVLLTGFGPLIARAELKREETHVHLRLDATADETLRLLDLASRWLGVAPVATP